MRRPDRDSLSTLALAGGTTFFAKSIHVAETAVLLESPSLLNMIAVGKERYGNLLLVSAQLCQRDKVALRNGRSIRCLSVAIWLLSHACSHRCRPWRSRYSR